MDCSDRASAIAFWWIYDPQFSIISYIFVDVLGVREHLFRFPRLGLAGALVAHCCEVWPGIPFVAYWLLAGLQTISPSLYEAALIDGATGWQRFRHITFPLLLPILAIVMTFSIIFTFTDFQLVYAITRGGPVNSTHLMATLAFQRGIAAGMLGEGAAIAIAMMPFLVSRRCSAISRSPDASGSKEKAMTSAHRSRENRPRRPPKRWSGRAGKSAPSSCLRAACLLRLILLFPFYWMTITAFKPNAELYSYKTHNPFWIAQPTLDHIRRLLFETSYPRWLWTTMTVAIGATFLSLFASVLAAYAIQRLRFRGSEYVGLAIYLGYLVPPSILFIPLSTTVFRLGLFDTPMALILVYPTLRCRSAPGC